MRYDRRICSTRAQNEGINGLLKTLAEGVSHPDPEVRKSAVLGSFARTALTSVALGEVVGQCGECLRNCPVTRKAHTLKVKEPAESQRLSR
jgi:hypothetical protein